MAKELFWMSSEEYGKEYEAEYGEPWGDPWICAFTTEEERAAYDEEGDDYEYRPCTREDALRYAGAKEVKRWEDHCLRNYPYPYIPYDWQD